MSIAVAPEEEQPIKGVVPVVGQTKAIKFFGAIEKRVAEALAAKGVFAYLPSLAIFEVEGVTILTGRYSTESVPLSAPASRLIGVLRDNQLAERRMEAQR